MMPRSVLGWLDASSCLARDGVSRTIAMMSQRKMAPATVTSRLANRPLPGLAAVRVSTLALLASILAAFPHRTTSFRPDFRSASVVIAGLSILVALWLIGHAVKIGIAGTGKLRNIK